MYMYIQYLKINYTYPVRDLWKFGCMSALFQNGNAAQNILYLCICITLDVYHHTQGIYQQQSQVSFPKKTNRPKQKHLYLQECLIHNRFLSKWLKDIYSCHLRKILFDYCHSRQDTSLRKTIRPICLCGDCHYSDF